MAPPLTLNAGRTFLGEKIAAKAITVVVGCLVNRWSFADELLSMLSDLSASVSKGNENG